MVSPIAVICWQLRPANRAAGLTGCWTRPGADLVQHPQMLDDILGATGMQRARTLMVGDTVYDMQMALNALVAGLGVSYGVHARDELLANGALACVDSFEAVCAWVT